MIKLADLAVKHPFYCNGSNYYSNEPKEVFNCASDFMDEYDSADIDMNLIFRWDVHQHDDGTYWVEAFIMQQRKGIFKPILIHSIEEHETKRFVDLLTKHKNQLMLMWQPLP